MDVLYRLFSSHVRAKLLATFLGRAEADLHREINYLVYRPAEFERKRRSDSFLKDVLVGPILWLKGGPS